MALENPDTLGRAMKLVFQSDRLSRSMTRNEWKAAWRWKRQTEKTLALYEARMQEQFNLLAADLSAYGTAYSLADKIINPALVIYPDPSEN